MGPCVSCMINASHTMGTNLLWSCIHIFIWFRKYLVYTQLCNNCAYQMALSPQGMNYAFKMDLVPFWQEMWWLMTRPGEAKGSSIKYVSTFFAIFDTPSSMSALCFTYPSSLFPQLLILPKKCWRILWTAPRPLNRNIKADFSLREPARA